MSYAEVYGLKFNYKELRELLREKYAERASSTEKYLLGHMGDELSKDLMKDYPKYKIGIFCTGFCDRTGEDCVLGIETVCYTLVEIERSCEYEGEYEELEETTFYNFDGFDRYWENNYGFKIHDLKHLKPANHRKYDVVIDAMKKLIDNKDVQKMNPSVYRVEWLD